MAHYGSTTPKRHYGYSNSVVVLELDKGKLYAHQRRPKTDRVKTADIYYDKNGVKRYKGNRNLRPTERLEFNFRRFMQFFFLCCVYYLILRFKSLRLCCFFLHVPPHTHQSHRVYPMRFARALIDLTDKMKSTALGAPELPAVVPTALEVFREWPQGNDSEEWPFAHFDVMFNYLRGSRKLKIPPEWRGTIADSLGDA